MIMNMSNQLLKVSKGRFIRVGKDWELYLLLLLPLIYIFIFKYIPMYGMMIAFKNFNPVQGIWGSDWIGMKYFIQFFNSPYFTQTLSNTLILSLYTLLATFPVPILFALALNELRQGIFKRSTQLITYAPHFISTVVVVSMLLMFLHVRGPVNQLLVYLGANSVDFMALPELFKTLFVTSEVWQTMGYSSIIYMAALSAIDPQLHEAAKMDGASRLRRIWHINMPGLIPTVTVLLILNLGQIMNLGFEKVYLMQNPVNISSSEIISTMVYKVGLIGGDFSYSTAVGLFNNVINLLIIIAANYLAKRITANSLW